MKDYLLGGLVTIVFLGLFSYTTTDGGRIAASRVVYNFPLKQKKVVSTDNIEYVNKLIKQGYVVQFVTEHPYRNSKTTYTLIKY